MSLVSIIIPTFNRETYIKETLNSIVNQTYTNWECIIIDDGSTDKTNKIVNNYILNDNRFTYFNRPIEKPKGANACRNYGFYKSKGEYILFLDSDDLLKENCLEDRVFEFKKNKVLDFVIANTSFYNKGVFLDKPICKYPEDYTPHNYLNLFLKYELPFTIMSVLWKKQAIINISFDEILPRLQDVDFHIQVLLQDNLNCKRLNQIDTFYRSDSGTKSSMNYNKIVVLASKLFFYKYVKGHYLDYNQKKQFRKFIIFFLVRYIYPYQKIFTKHVKEIDVIIKYSNVFSIKQLVVLKVYKFLIRYNLHTKTGLGMHTLTKFFKKTLHYD